MEKTRSLVKKVVLYVFVTSILGNNRKQLSVRENLLSIQIL